MQLCNRDDLKQYLLDAYLQKAEEFNEGLIEAQINNVSGEIIELLSYRYKLTPPVPNTIRHIASVMAAYRIVSAITTLITTEAQSDNEWLPLQKQYNYAKELLQDLASGKNEMSIQSSKDNTSVIVTRKASFDLDRY